MKGFEGFSKPFSLLEHAKKNQPELKDTSRFLDLHCPQLHLTIVYHPHGSIMFFEIYFPIWSFRICFFDKLIFFYVKEPVKQ